MNELSFLFLQLYIYKKALFSAVQFKTEKRAFYMAGGMILKNLQIIKGRLYQEMP